MWRTLKDLVHRCDVRSKTWCTGVTYTQRPGAQVWRTLKDLVHRCDVRSKTWCTGVTCAQRPGAQVWCTLKDLVHRCDSTLDNPRHMCVVHYMTRYTGVTYIQWLGAQVWHTRYDSMHICNIHPKTRCTGGNVILSLPSTTCQHRDEPVVIQLGWHSQTELVWRLLSWATPWGNERQNNCNWCSTRVSSWTITVCDIYIYIYIYIYIHIYIYTADISFIVKGHLLQCLCWWHKNR